MPKPNRRRREMKRNVIVMALGTLIAAGFAQSVAAFKGGQADSAGELISEEGVFGGICESLTNLQKADTTVTSAANITPPFTPPGGGAPIMTPFCRVVGMASPTSDSI